MSDFQVMTLIQNTLQCDNYLPTRRSAALVLADILSGMNDLQQFQEFLLPIYRTLKHLAEHDADLHVQVHARNGLACLRDKVKELLSAEHKIEKEIRIFDVKRDDEPILFK